MQTSRVSLETWLNLFALDLLFVLLVVLVIFMTITPMLPLRPWVDTPISTSAVKSPEGYRDLTVSIPIADLFILENKVVPFSELDRQFASAPGDKDFKVRIRAGRRVPFGDVRRVVLAAREAGITHVTFVFNAPPPTPSQVIETTWPCPPDYGQLAIALVFAAMAFLGAVAISLRSRKLPRRPGCIGWLLLIIVAIALMMAWDAARPSCGWLYERQFSERLSVPCGGT